MSNHGYFWVDNGSTVGYIGIMKTVATLIELETLFQMLLAINPTATREEFLRALARSTAVGRVMIWMGGSR